ncbi:MAG: AtuA-related protein [Mycobacteriales bacterium]
MVAMQLRDFCATRAGDKGDTANVAIFAYEPAAYRLLVAVLTEQVVAAHLGSLLTGSVRRYEAANLLGLNFVLSGALGGGGPRSLRSDALGKTLGGALLRISVEVPDDLAERIRRPRPDITALLREAGR